MEGASGSSPHSSSSQPQDMEVVHAPMLPDDASNVWDWGDLLDFTLDDELAVQLAADHAQARPDLGEDDAVASGNPDPGRVRKRDARLVCSNFLAGRVPCACPEIDEMMMELEEEEAGHDKKRQRKPPPPTTTTTPRSNAGSARCQVPSCGADIKELKGYHRRHRVCLRCANAATVTLGGESKRYCQQCGKFHVLSDFDEGKRSCRRKLENHNRRRRRRKPADSVEATEKEFQGDIQSEDASGDGEAGKDGSQGSGQMVQKETCVESEARRVSSCNAATDVNSDGVVSLADSVENQMEGRNHNSKHGVSPSYRDKSAYSSICPTGRISFKLYDWNPAEFPRRLRLQIFQWLANMPVELEGYIRPGCIILTVFVAMPRFMWKKLSEDPISYVQDIVVAPGGVLSGRGNVLVYLNNMVFRVVKGGTSVIKAKADLKVPRLHYVHPICFEAGKPMELIACGSNLLQPKMRFLLSFSGNYLAYHYGTASSHLQTEGSTSSNFDHQLCKIYVPHTEANCFGPVFIEVENEAGLSNFIPVLIGDKETCSELKVIQQKLDESLFSDELRLSSTGSLSNACEVSSLRQAAFYEFILDIAWLLKKPGSENFQQTITSFQVKRLECLLNLLLSVESTTILEKILQNLKTSMDTKYSFNGVGEADLRPLQKYIYYGRQLHRQSFQRTQGLGHLISKEESVSLSCSQKDASSVVSLSVEDTEIMVNGKLGVIAGSAYYKKSETIPILNGDKVSKANATKKWPITAPCRAYSTEGLVSHHRSFLRSRPTLYLIAVTAVCLGVCSVFFHPRRVSEFAVSIRRCLLEKF